MASMPKLVIHPTHAARTAPGMAGEPESFFVGWLGSLPLYQEASGRHIQVSIWLSVYVISARSS